ncbi:MAG: hypothetical protein EB060_12615 [Proteobacteria bacterium]|nr:hypothetical protein [Pseudomonadota bacterium]
MVATGIQTFGFDDRERWLERRKHDVTSTEIAALFGKHPRITEYELFHAKSGSLDDSFTPNERMLWGTRLQDSIAAGVAEDQGWVVRKKDEYMRDPRLRLGASFDFEIVSGKGVSEPGILEIKNVDGLIFRNEWAYDEESDSFEAPMHIEFQLQQQMLLSAYSWGCIAVLVGGNKTHILRRDYIPEIGRAITSRVMDFWTRVDSKNPPEPSFERDAEVIRQLHQHVRPGTMMDALGDAKMASLAMEYRRLGAEANAMEAKRQAIKAELLTLIGDHEKVAGDGFVISAGVVGPASVSYERKGYRDFRISARKAK